MARDLVINNLVMTTEERIELAKESQDPEVLDLLSRDEKYTVRYRVADNPNTSAETLDRLSRDEDNYVRVGVAKKPNTLIDTLTRLSRDEDYWVRHHAIRNSKWKAVQKSGLLAVARSASKFLKIL